MTEIPADLRQRLESHGQQHVLARWAKLDAASRSELLGQLEKIDLDELMQLYARRDKPGHEVPTADRIAPIPYIPHDAPDNAARRAEGESALRAGQVAVLLVAGGQGSRLGFEHPKGMYPVGPVSRKSLFAIHAEKVLALSRRYGKALPFLIMTSPATHDETEAYFKEQNFFQLDPAQVQFFCQGTMPALDLATGQLLFEAPGRLFVSPDGHGGTLMALAKSGLLAQLQKQGITQVFYFQVDNPLVRIADPVFIGHHLHANAEVSSKVVAKVGPREKMGVFASVEGRCTIIEYSDLPESLAHAVEPDGRLRLWAGSPAIHLFSVEFLQRMTRNPQALPFHIARKKVPHVDEAGTLITPKVENALKFERFIFDVLPAADRWTVVEALREDEFAPLKNAEGADSPATVEQALLDQARRWVRAAGGDVAPGVRLEFSPLYALDAEELASKWTAGSRIETDWYQQ